MPGENHAIEHASIHTVAMLGNYAPRRCGIATFTTDLSEAISEAYPALDCFVLAMNDGGGRHAYPDRVRFEIAEGDLASYRRAADFLNVNAVDLVCVQHEYGIFGGKAGSYVLGLLRELRMPIVCTLHTVLSEPSSAHRQVMEELTSLSERIVVMSSFGADLLKRVHGVPSGKIDVIPHGIPPSPPTRASKAKLGVEGKSVILTFGLLSPDKGIETVIDALPEIVERCPNALYIVLGATHPHVKQRHGETYRLHLESRAERLAVDGHILFHDRFVSQTELTEFLAAADIYVTPYLKAEQVTSGTLAYAVGAGKAVISTPYSYAREMLADGRGILVPWQDPAAIAREVIALFASDEERLSMGARAAEFGSKMVWPNVAKLYAETFERARSSHVERRRSVFEAKTLARRPAALPSVDLSHVRAMTDGTGLLQHARFHIPRYEDGYCLDDNARGLLLTALLEDAGSEEHRTVRLLSSRYLAFVSHAFNETTGRFRNFMSYSRTWTEEAGSEDSHGRGVWALGAVIGHSRDPAKQTLSRVLFHRALDVVPEFSSPRAWAFTLLGIGGYLRAFEGDSSVESLRLALAERLLDVFQRASGPDWHWFEESATYENARMSQALLQAGDALGREDMKEAALRSLDWLLTAQSGDAGDFAPIGSNGFYPRDGEKARFDQQPVEAWATVSACLEAARVTSDVRWGLLARRTFAWFLGQNHLQVAIYDASTGGCRDGLHPDRLNENQGAESTLSYLIALLELRSAELSPKLRAPKKDLLS